MENKNILIIDDDPAMIKLFELIAKKAGFNVVSATNGSEGIKKLSQQDFILVITDLKMPVMNGIEFIKQARKIPKFINFPFVIVTGNFQEFSADVALLKNLTIMEKPIKQKDLQDLLNNTLKISSTTELSKIPTKELFTFLNEKLQKISSLMLEIITKSKPQIKILKEIPAESFFEGFYFVSHLISFENNKFGVVFNFDLNITKVITKELAEGKDFKTEIILECLSKVATSMMKKIAEGSPYPENFITSIPFFLLGSGENKTIFGTLNKNLLANIYAKNDKGILTIHILKI